MRLFEIMTEAVEAIGPEQSAEKARAVMQGKRIHHLVVMDGRRVLGVLSDRDLGGRHRVGALAEQAVSELMTANPITATSRTSLREAANLLRGRSIGCLPVLDGGRLVGIVTVTDLLKLLGRGSVGLSAPGRRQKPIRKLVKTPRTPAVTARH